MLLAKDFTLSKKAIYGGLNHYSQNLDVDLKDAPDWTLKFDDPLQADDVEDLFIVCFYTVTA